MDYRDKPPGNETGSSFNRRNRAKWVRIKPALTLIQVCSVIYDASTPLDENTFASVTNPLAQNVIEFVRGLRTGADAWNPPEIYALLVFDSALVQLGGLSFGTSGNRIADPRAAGAVAAFVARWYGRIRKGGSA